MIYRGMNKEERNRIIEKRCQELGISPNNIPMQKCLNKNGFKYCGKILMPEVQNDDILRIAFDKKS